MILLDSNILAAVLNTRDTQHRRANDFLASTADELMVSPLVIDEVAHLLTHRQRRWDAQTALLASFGDPDGLSLADLTDGDLARMAELSGQCESARIDATDLSIVAIAERLGVASIATFDRRDFTIVRPSHIPGLHAASVAGRWVRGGRGPVRSSRGSPQRGAARGEGPARRCRRGNRRWRCR